MFFENSVGISAGETKEVSINLQNNEPYVAFQFDLYLPEGISIESYSANRERIPESTSLSMAQVNNGAYRFVAAAMESEPLIGYEGNIITLTVKAAETIAPNWYTGYFNNIKLSRQDAVGIVIPWNMDFSVWVLEPTVVTAYNITRRYGEENPDFDYYYSGSELKGEPTITCAATATSPVGTYDIIVSRGTVTNYNVTYVAGTLTVEPAPLAVKAGTYTKKQGEDNPEFTLTYDGFKNNETEAVLTRKPTATTTATKESAPGEYDVIVSGGEAQNYELSYTNGKLIVTEADAVVVTAKSYTRVYGEANPILEYEVNGATLDGTPEIICEATTTSPVGTYDIVVKQGSVKNYNVTYLNGTLTITKAPLTVKVEDATREQYLENPEFVITYTGWKLNDDENVLTKKPTATTTATKDSPVGEYEIVVSGGEAKNYELNYENGILTVTESTGIVILSAIHPVNVYTVQGRMVRSKATTLDGLPKGVYIVNGRKVVVRQREDGHLKVDSIR